MPADGGRFNNTQNDNGGAPASKEVELQVSSERTRPRPALRRSEGVRAFKRGLDVLREVNWSGGIRAGDVARQLDLPRPTVYRLLETLEELGYIERSSSDDRFRVTRRAA